MKKATSRLFILATLLFAPVYLAHAQKQVAIPRIGVLYLGVPPNANFDVFIQELHELGYIEGKNILIEYRYAEGKEDRLPELATELVRLKVDAIFTAGTPALFALKQATKTIPIGTVNYIEHIYGRTRKSDGHRKSDPVPYQKDLLHLWRG